MLNFFYSKTRQTEACKGQSTFDFCYDSAYQGPNVVKLYLKRSRLTNALVEMYFNTTLIIVDRCNILAFFYLQRWVVLLEFVRSRSLCLREEKLARANRDR